MLNKIKEVNFKKYSDGLVPCIIQDYLTGQVLMLGYMNEDSLTKTIETGKVTFFSRQRQELWTKGATSGNYLFLEDWGLDCDQDAILVLANPVGPTCHTGTTSCFRMNKDYSLQILGELNKTIANRDKSDCEKSYTKSLLKEGVKRISQKVGEEGVEVALAGLYGDKLEIANESADLVYHLLVLLYATKVDFNNVTQVLRERMKK